MAEAFLCKSLVQVYPNIYMVAGLRLEHRYVKLPTVWRKALICVVFHGFKGRSLSNTSDRICGQ